MPMRACCSIAVHAAALLPLAEPEDVAFLYGGVRCYMPHAEHSNAAAHQCLTLMLMHHSRVFCRLT